MGINETLIIFGSSMNISIKGFNNSYILSFLMLKIIKFRYKQIWMDEIIIRKNLDKKNN